MADDTVKTLVTPDEERLPRVQLAVSWFTTASNNAQQFHNRCKEAIRYYRMVPETDWPLPIQLRSPATLSLVEDAVSTIIGGIFSADPIIRCRPRGSLIADTIATQLEKVLAIILSYEEGQLRLALENFVRDAALYGTSFLRVLPIFYDDITRRGQLRYIRFDNVHPMDIFPDPAATSITNARWVIIRRIVNIAELDRIARTEHHIENVRKLRKLAAGVADFPPDVRTQLAELGLIQPDYTPRADSIELLYVYLATTDHNLPAMFVVADRIFEIFSIDAADNPFIGGIPIVEFKWIPQPYEFWGLGIPNIVRDLQRQDNLTRTMRALALGLVLSPTFTVRAGSTVRPDDVKLAPGHVIPVPNHDDIQQLSVSDPTQSSYMETMQLQRDMELATGLHSIARGMATTKRQTGLEVFQLAQAALRRLDTVLKRFEFTVMRRLAALCALYIRHFLPQAVYEELLGDTDAGFYQLTTEDILRGTLFQAVGAQVSSVREIRSQTATMLFNIIGSTPLPLLLQSGYTIDYAEVIRLVLKSLDINPDTILRPIKPDQAQQLLQLLMPKKEQATNEGAQPADMAELLGGAAPAPAG